MYIKIKTGLGRYILYLVSFMMFLFITALSPADKITIAVINLKTSPNLQRSAGADISERIRMHLKHIEKFKLMEINEMNDILNKQGFLRPSGCRSIECHSTSFDSQGTLQFLEKCGISDNEVAMEIGSMLEVDKIVYGLVNKLEDKYTIIIKIIDIATGHIEISDQVSSKPDIKNLDARIDELAARLAERISNVNKALGHLDKKSISGESKGSKREESPLLENFGEVKDMNELRTVIQNRIRRGGLDRGPKGEEDFIKQQTKESKDFKQMVLIPAGPFRMGSDKFEGESPAHEVYLDAFYIDRYEVTNSMYKDFLDATGYRPPPFWGKAGYNHPDQPITGISWESANEYALWAGKRLPTEAEWEKAARGMDERLYPWGDEWSESKCRSSGMDTISEGPATVGSFPDGVSYYGCHDMAGNVWEWCADWFSFDYYGQSEYRNPKGPDEGSFHVLRGGGWNSKYNEVRTTTRRGGCPDGGYSCAGFRCVRDVIEHK